MTMQATNYKGAVRGIAALLAIFGVAFLVGSLAAAQPASAGSAYYWPSNGWNGYRVYLSPAYHAGQNVGCDGYVEDDVTEGAPDIAKEAASGYGTDLKNRHYYVKVRWGVSASTKISDSNAWGAHIHIPIHSNAKTEDCDAGASYGGTWIIKQYSSQHAFAEDLLDALDGASPGTDDDICWTWNCTNYSSLGELTQTYAKAAYVEADFHSYDLGVDWLRERTWQWRIGYGVDMYLGYPREPYIY